MQIQRVQNKIYELRGLKIMLDFDLALLYDVETKRLNEQVQRNIERFPEDFMFQISKSELQILMSQFATSSWGGRRKMPYAFTEQGVAMLSGVLKSKKAIAVNLSIMRAFVLMRHYAVSHNDLEKKLKFLEDKYDTKFKDVYQALNYLITKEKEVGERYRRKKIGFKTQPKKI